MYVGVVILVTVVFATLGAVASWLVLAQRSRRDLEERDKQVWALEGKLDRLRSELTIAQQEREHAPSGGPFRTASDEVSPENMAELPSTYSADVIATKAAASAEVAQLQAEADRKIAIANLELEQVKERCLADTSALNDKADAEKRRNEAELEHQIALIKASSEAELRKRRVELDHELEATRSKAQTKERRLRSELDHELEAVKTKALAERRKNEAELEHAHSKHLLERSKLNRDNARLSTEVRALTKELDHVLALSPLSLEKVVHYLAGRVSSLTERIERAKTTRDAQRVDRVKLEQNIEVALEKLHRLDDDPSMRSFRTTERAKLETQREQVIRDSETSEDIVSSLEAELGIAARCLRDLEQRLGSAGSSSKP